METPSLFNRILKLLSPLALVQEGRTVIALLLNDIRRAALAEELAILKQEDAISGVVRRGRGKKWKFKGEHLTMY